MNYLIGLVFLGCLSSMVSADQASMKDICNAIRESIKAINQPDINADSIRALEERFKLLCDSELALRFDWLKDVGKFFEDAGKTVESVAKGLGDSLSKVDKDALLNEALKGAAAALPGLLIGLVGKRDLVAERFDFNDIFKSLTDSLKNIDTDALLKTLLDSAAKELPGILAGLVGKRDLTLRYDHDQMILEFLREFREKQERERQEREKNNKPYGFAGVDLNNEQLAKFWEEARRKAEKVAQELGNSLSKVDRDQLVQTFFNSLASTLPGFLLGALGKRDV